MAATGRRKFKFTAPVLTDELLRDILDGRAAVAPEMDDALRLAEQTGDFVCPYCQGKNDGIPRVRSCGMGVESVAMFLEILANPASRDFCLCQLVNVTMQTGDEHADTISNMETYVLPLYRYFRLRFVELARAGEYERDGIVVLQDTDRPERLHPEGFYKLSDYLLRNGTVPQSGGEHLCSMKFKAFCCEYWLEWCFQMNGVYHLFGYSAEERSRAAKSDRGIEMRNAKVLKRSKVRRGAQRPGRRRSSPRVLVRVAGETFETYEMAEVEIEPVGRGGRVARSGRALRCVAMFGYSAEETGRAAKATRYDGQARVSYVYSRDESGRFRAVTLDGIERRGVYLLIRWGWKRLRCWQSIHDRLGVDWQKSCCVECPFDKDASKCTAHGVERKKLNPAKTARSLMLEYASMCLNERGLLYVKRSLHAVVLQTEQVEALEIFERELATMEHCLFEVKRIYFEKDDDPSQKGTARRSVIRLASGTREAMNAEFARRADELSLKVRTVNGISYAVFAERGEVFPAIEGFLVVGPSKVDEKVQGSFSRFESRFAQVARSRGIILPNLPGTSLVGREAMQDDLFDVAVAA